MKKQDLKKIIKEEIKSLFYKNKSIKRMDESLKKGKEELEFVKNIMRKKGYDI